MTELLDDVHRSLVVAFHWLPDDAWDTGLAEALGYLASDREREITLALVQAVAFVSPTQLFEMVENGGRAQSIEERFGPQVAAEVEALDRENTEWLRAHRGKA